MFPLNATESLDLVRYIDASSNLNRGHLESSGGNPLLIEDQAKCGSSTDRRNEALKWMLSQIPKEAQRFAEALSVLRKPTDLETIAKICGQNICNLEAQITD